MTQIKAKKTRRENHQPTVECLMNYYADKNVVVAGGAGFIGAHLVRALLGSGACVRVLDNFHTGRRTSLGAHPALEIIEHDVTQPYLCADVDIDVVFNLACPASPVHYQADPIATWRSSVYGTDNLLTLAGAHNARFVQCSTSEVYGDPEQTPQHEDYNGNVTLHGPRACYDEGKRAAETLIHDVMRTTDLDTRIARIFNTYGSGMALNDGRVVSNFIHQALTGRPLTVFGDGQQTRSFCHVSDTIQGILLLGQTPDIAGCVVNIGSDEEHTILDFAKSVAQVTGVQVSLTHETLPKDDPKRRRADISRALNILGWRPKVDLESGLREMLGDFESRVN